LIYLDSSVVLARLLAEYASPPDRFWAQRFVSSRLLAYEVMNRVNQHHDVAGLIANAQAIIDRIEWVEMAPAVLARALAPFPVPVRTLDGLHLATMAFLLANGQSLRLASYDKRLVDSAKALGVEIETGL
jgi:predicted nucleic acid-binding protein